MDCQTLARGTRLDRRRELPTESPSGPHRGSLIKTSESPALVLFGGTHVFELLTPPFMA